TFQALRATIGDRVRQRPARDHLDLDQGALRQRGDADGRTGQRRGGPVLGVDRADGREVANVREEERRLHYVVEAEARRVEDRLEVPDRPIRLGLDTIDEL